MRRTAAIVGVGYSGFRSISPDLSYKELMYEAAAKAYEDAGVDPQRDIESFGASFPSDAGWRRHEQFFFEPPVLGRLGLLSVFCFER